jgi:hypothetical protein
VARASSEPSPSRFPGNVFVQKGREAVGRGQRSRQGPRGEVAHTVTGNQVTEILVLGGERFRVQGAPDEVESKIVDAARGSMLELVSLTEAESGELIALNPAHIVAVSSAR